MGIGSRATHRSTCRGAGGSRHRVTVLGKHRHVARVGRHRESIGRVGRDLRAVLRPLGEGIARVGGRRQRAAGSIVIGARTAHGATCRGTG